MENTKHTPGPWVIAPHTTVNKEFTVGPAIMDYDDVDHDQQEANARLIAASPDYAAAVEQMLAHEQAGGDGWWKGFEMLKAAHAKATQP